MMNYEILAWDSDFFQFKVGRITKPGLDRDELQEALRALYEEGAKLVYYGADDPGYDLSFLSPYFEGRLIEKKMTYTRPADSGVSPDGRISSYREDYPSEKLIGLAVQSGACSRFCQDKKIGERKFGELYTSWIVNSVSRKIADEVLVYREQDEILGFVTIGVKAGAAAQLPPVAEIGIIAVDDPYRGRGIGRLLMEAAGDWARKHAYPDIRVVTQEINAPARMLYIACGYELTRVEEFYHYWKPGPSSPA